MLKWSALALALVTALSCSESTETSGWECTDGKCDGPSSDPLWTDKVFERAAAILGEQRGRSFRYALDRAVNELGGFDVQAWPNGSCHNSQPEQLFWNGENRSLSRLGIVGIANVVALEAISFEGGEEYHVTFLGWAPGNDHAAQRALEVIATIDSPRLLHAAVTALSQNHHLSAGARRTLLGFDADLTSTKHYRGADQNLRVPNLSAPISVSALLDQLRAVPVPSFRITLAQLLMMTPEAGTHTEIDSLLEDPNIAVRIEAMPLFWRGSDTSVQRQNALLAWIDGAEAKRQLRLQFLGALTDAEAAGWAPEPAGFLPFYLENVAEFVGGALRTAPADANIRPLLARAATFRDISQIVEDSAAVTLRSTALGLEEKETILISLIPAAHRLRDNEFPNAANVIWRLLAARMLAAPRADLVTLMHGMWTPPSVNRAAIEAQLTSTDAATRLAGVQAFAPFEGGFMAAVFDAGAGTEALLANQPGFVLSAALDAGTHPQVIIDHVLGFAKPHFGDTEPYLEFWNGSEMPYAYALVKALSSPVLTQAERTQNIIAFAHVISPRNTFSPTGAPGPGALYLGPIVSEVLAQLGNDAAAWEAVLVRDGGTELRNHLLDYTPDTGPIRTLVKQLVRPHLVVPANTCWTGNSSTATYQPGLNIWSIPFALSAANAPVDISGVVDARIEGLRIESSATPELPADATVDTLLATHPVAKNAYYGAWPWTRAVRQPYELPAAEIAARLPAAVGEQRAHHVYALALAPDFDQLPASVLSDLDATLDPLSSFLLHLAKGDGYDALASKFRSNPATPLRWDLADQARGSGEVAALERLLATADRTFLVKWDLTNAISRVAAKANVSETFRHSLAQMSADGVAAWSSGPLPLARMRASSLDEMLAGAAYRIAQPQTIDLPPAALVGMAVRDDRLSPDAALRLSWITLSAGQFRPGDFNNAPVTITYAIDMTLGVMSRADVSTADKQALGRALLRVLH